MSQLWLFRDVMAASPVKLAVPQGQGSWLCPRGSDAWAVMPGLCPVQGSWHLEGSGAAWLPQSCAGRALEAHVCAGCMEGHCPQGSLSSAALRRAGMKDAVPEKQVR